MEEDYTEQAIDLMPQLLVPMGRNLRSTASSSDAWFFPSPVCRIIFPFVIQMTPLPRELQSSAGPLEPGVADPPPLCFEWGFTRTFPGNQDVAVK